MEVERIPMTVTARESAAQSEKYLADRMPEPAPVAPMSQSVERKPAATTLAEKFTARELAAKANGEAIE